MRKSHKSLRRKDVQNFFLDAGYRSRTREERLRDLDQFADWAEQKTGRAWQEIDWNRMRELVDPRGRHLAWDQVDEEFVGEFVGLGNPKSSTRARRIMALKMYFGHLTGHDLLADNPLENVPYPKRHRPELLALTAEQLRALVQGAKEGRDGERNHTLVAAYAWGAYRKTEVVALRVTDLDLDEGAVHLSLTKTRRSERRILPAPAQELILQWLGSPRRPESHWIFPGQDPRQHLSSSAAYDVVRRAGERAGIERRVTPLILRHTVATLLHKNGMSLQGVSEILGHSSVEVTQRYIDRSPASGAAREALEPLGRLWDDGLI